MPLWDPYYYWLIVPRAPAPVITGITPNSGSDLGGTAITDLHGTGFQAGATVTFDGIAATSVVRVSSVKITCVTPANAAGPADVKVRNPDTQNSGTSGNAIFTYIHAARILTETGDYLTTESGDYLVTE